MPLFAAAPSSFASATFAALASLAAAELGLDDECWALSSGSVGADCALSALQRRGTKILNATEELPLLDSCGSSQSCYPNTGKCYQLTWSAQGHNFFDNFTFLEAGDDGTHGATVYVDREDALRDGLAEAHDTHAILRTGGRGSWLYKRKSVSLHSGYTWSPSDYFLVAMRFNHVPQGVGVWPAFWTKAPGYVWPLGSELDIMEYANGAENKASLHVSPSTPCVLDKDSVNKCGRFPEANQNSGYDCVTDYYTGKVGCGPNSDKKITAQYLNEHPGVLAAEWTTEHIKVFYIPEEMIPEDLSNDQPRPSTWDKFIYANFPLAESDRAKPGSCHKRKDAFKPQEVVLNIGLCGDWAGMTQDTGCQNAEAGDTCSEAITWARMHGLYEHPEWYEGLTSSSTDAEFQAHLHTTAPEKCHAPCVEGETAFSDIDKLMMAKLNSQKCKNDVFQPAEDCCTQFMWDINDTIGVSDYLSKHAYFNITWLKVYQQADAPPPAPPPPPPAGSCSLAPGCVKVGLKHGMCCPAPNGMMMGCCQSMGEEACEKHPKCAALGLGGACCPNVNGIRMGCCEDSHGPILHGPAVQANASLGAAACARHPKCALLNLNGACCPNGAGVTMGCCEAPLVAPRKSPVALGASACGRHPKCAALNITGQCCPNAAGASMDCCETLQVLKVLDPSSDAAIGAAACGRHPKCAALNLTGACCPNGAGASMGCCEARPSPAVTPMPVTAVTTTTLVGTTTISETLPTTAMCSNHPRCAALNLSGACCPTISGVFMGCCNGAEAPEATTTPVSTTTATQSLSATSVCSNHPRCAALNLSGACCPTIAGVSMGCCNGTEVLEASFHRDDASLGASACAKHPACAALNLTGACCPNIAGVSMGCCDGADVGEASSSSDAASLGSSACARHPACAALKLTGSCCPNNAGVSMGCCNASESLEASPPAGR
eukprot:TRINITY_DN31163_c0_g1_i1.p1 TRINITY_DN31163_c0_g1~~TRINITY_DN31163_c0_g1_i1.p1  ORF type:complete len:944 (+),score=135.18 TRINITY_DN31163_c0_g1_i1:44-2875(+)